VDDGSLLANLLFGVNFPRHANGDAAPFGETEGEINFVLIAEGDIETEPLRFCVGDCMRYSEKFLNIVHVFRK